MSDLVSIVIPIYNSGEYLEECLNSILLQDYMNWEAILVNDGSTDRSEMICKQFASQDTRFKVIDKENGGVSSARNSGLREANGDYICFIDSDDYIKNNYLSHLYGLIKTHNAKLALCKFDKGEEKVSDTRVISGKNRALTSLFDTKKGIQGYIGAKMFCADIIKNQKLFFNEDQHLGEDLLFIYEYLSFCDDYCRVAFSNEALYCYIPRENSALRKMNYDVKFDIRWTGILNAYDIISQKTNEKPLQKAIKLNKVMQSVTLLRAMLRCGFEDKLMIKSYSKFIRKNLFAYMVSNLFPMRKRVGALLISVFPCIFKK